ncbi:MAG: helix-turn-helix domain-containing protein [candidate division NC10 bacterium]
MTPTSEGPKANVNWVIPTTRPTSELKRSRGHSTARMRPGSVVRCPTPTPKSASRHLRRLSGRHAGASPTAVATTQRVQRAKALVDETVLPMSAIAFAAGFASIRRFNAAFHAVYRRPPTAVRRARPRPRAGIESRPRRLTVLMAEQNFNQATKIAVRG